MEKIELKKLIKKAYEFNSRRIKWHNHFLMPKCIFNKEKNYVVILEDETNNKVYYAAKRKKPTKEMEELEKLFYLSIKK